MWRWGYPDPYCTGCKACRTSTAYRNKRISRHAANLLTCRPRILSSASATSRIAELASTIWKASSLYCQYFINNQLPAPSSAADGPLLDDQFPPSMEAARVEVHDAAVELRELTLGPRILLQKLRPTAMSTTTFFTARSSPRRFL